MSISNSRRSCLIALTLALALPIARVHAQTYTALHNFTNADGCCSIYPSMMTQGEDGNIYGATTSGGLYGYGTIFVITPAGALTALHHFNGTDGMGPQGGISIGLDGNFYGTTYLGGGVNHYGTIFKITPNGTFTSLYAFSNSTDGAYPRTPPVQAQNGNLYGTTGNGQVAVLYKLTPAGVFSVVASLASQSYSPLLLAKDGNLYGTTLYGGTYNAGTLFRFSPSTSKVTTLFSFRTEWSPTGPLIQGQDGILYGTTSAGGTGSGGCVYRFSISSPFGYKVLYNFTSTGATDGRDPQNGVVQGSDSYLYGTASGAGALGLGTLFRVSITGSFQLLYSFQTPTGDTPASALLLHTNGLLYGQTHHGGANTAYGTIFSFDNHLSPFVTPLVLRSAKVGAAVSLLGQGFSTNPLAVCFNQCSTIYSVKSDTFLTATVPAGAKTGLIQVFESGKGWLASPLPFSIIPTIKSFTPSSGPVGTQVTITGVSLSQTTSVKFGGVITTAITINSDTQVTATVPTGAVTGKISIATLGGTATSASAFTVQ